MSQRIFHRLAATLPTRIFAGLLVTVGGLASFPVHAQDQPADMVRRAATDPNLQTGTDNERIQSAIEAARQHGGVVRVPRRTPDATSPRDYWLLDEAIRLPSDTTLILENCRLKLSDRCRDNFIRSANCGIGIADIQPLQNIHIVGVGGVILEGADHPRATGDAVKTLGKRTYGTDGGKPDRKQTGDWRNIGILLAFVENFSIRNLELKDYHAWGVSLEHCAFGNISDLRFSADNGKTIDGRFETYLNQDGLDLRKGCHDITIENISGHSGDDLIALTGISRSGSPPGGLDSTMVSGSNPRGEADDMSNIIIRNVRGYCAGGHHIVRFLNSSGIRMHDILLDGLIDTSPAGLRAKAVIRIGDSNPAWGGVTPLGDTARFTITNINGRGRSIVLIAGSLCDSQISNVLIHDPALPALSPASGAGNVRNVTITNVTHVGADRPADAE